MTVTIEPVRLSVADLRWADAVGNARHDLALRTGARPGYRRAMSDPLKERGMQIIGTRGELAAARFFGVEWRPTIGPRRDATADGVGQYEIRTRLRPEYGLLMFAKDRAERVYVHVTTSRMAVAWVGAQWLPDLGRALSFLVHGWVWGREVFGHPEWLGSITWDEPGYFVPGSALHPVASIPPPEYL